MILLQSQDKFDDIAELDPQSGKISWTTRDSVQGPIRGHIGRLGDVLACLYRDEQATLHFRVGDRDFSLTEGMQVKLTPGPQNSLALVRGNEVLYTSQYKPARSGRPLAFDPTPFVEAEDFDIGLFAANVTQDRARRNRIYLQPDEQGKPKSQ